MTKKLLATTALIVMFSGAALAQTATPAPATPEAPAADSASPMKLFEGGNTTPMESANGYFTAAEGQVLASQLIDQDVYTSAGEDGENIGKVQDLLFNGEGRVQGAVVSVGGFLGMGAKEVAVDIANISVLPEANDPEDWRVIVEQTREQLEAAPAFERDAAEAMPAEGAAPATGTGTTVTPPATEGTEQSPATGTAPSPTNGGSTSQ